MSVLYQETIPSFNNALNNLHFLFKKTIFQLEDLYNFPIKDVSFGQDYMIAIRSKNPFDIMLESPLIQQIIRTPTCIEQFNSLETCGKISFLIYKQKTKY